jgi:hypothetical protein
MSESKPETDRRALLAFVERYWTELTLREARFLCVESLDVPSPRPASIKEALTFR